MQEQLSVAQATRLIFRQSSPRADQTRCVERWLASGDLSGTQAGPHWYTTRDAIADLLSKRVIGSLAPHAGDADEGEEPTTQHELSQSALVHTYREAMKDYFLGVLLRRQVQNATRAWRRAVLVGQIAIVAIVASTVLLGLASLLRAMPPEHRAIYDWLEATHTDRFTVQQIDPPLDAPDGNGKIFSVQYHYESKNRGRIRTQQYFHVQDGQVLGVASDQ